MEGEGDDTEGHIVIYILWGQGHMAPQTTVQIIIQYTFNIISYKLKILQQSASKCELYT